MQYLVIFSSNPKFKTDGMPSDFQQRELEDEAQVQVLYMEGGLRQAWALDTKDHGAVVLFEAESPEHVQKMIDSFPLIKADYSNPQILPLAPYPAFAKKSV
ncbi:muconolactone Delta-isomerase family protein [Nostoc sp.]|uniref:muconolactone Delta-isomerase family protein n=1 Tax=Nostoc sp. TaxID=1180 RepID=UPI002FF747FC